MEGLLHFAEPQQLLLIVTSEALDVTISLAPPGPALEVQLAEPEQSIHQRRQ